MKAAMSAVGTREEIMRAWTLIELFRLTRAELFGLYQEIVNALAAMPDSDPGRLIALANLQNIRRALARPHLAPR
jgi:hypothetical protein